MTGTCMRCGVDIDRDRQCTALGEALVIVGTVTDPITDYEWEVIYCLTCVTALGPELYARWPAETSS